jgi:hypothetical protein
MPEAPLQACEYVLIRVAPDPIRGEHVNIGVALFGAAAGGFAGVRISPDLRRARQLSPLFEPGDLAGLEAELAARLRTAAPHWLSRRYLLDLARESFSHGLQFSPPRAVLTADPAAELDRLYRAYAAPPPALERQVEAGVRRRILAHLQRVFTEQRLWARLERNARPGDWLAEPDPFRFDLAYRAGERRHVIQALPLDAGAEAGVKELCFTVERVRARLGFLDAAAFVEPQPPPPPYPRALLDASGIRLLLLDQAAAEAARIRAVLAPPPA